MLLWITVSIENIITHKRAHEVAPRVAKLALAILGARAQPQAQASRKRRSTTSTATVHAKAKEAAAEPGVYDIDHLVRARLEADRWFYLVEWTGYAEPERTW